MNPTSVIAYNKDHSENQVPMRNILILSTLILGGCLSNNVLMSSSTAQQNVERIGQLHIGMTQEEVYQIMRYPTSEDQVTTEEGCYDVWFYITKSSVLDQNRLVARNLTPLIFKDGVFIGMGNEYYNRLVRKTKAPVLAPSKEEREKENIELEKNLNPETKSQKIPSSKPAKGKSKKSISMCSKLKKSQPENESSTDQTKTSEEPKSPQLDEEDREFLEQEKEENFNDW